MILVKYILSAFRFCDRCKFHFVKCIEVVSLLLILYLLWNFSVLLSKIHISSLLVIIIPFWKEFSLYMCTNTMSNRAKSNLCFIRNNPVVSSLKRIKGVKMENLEKAVMFEIQKKLIMFENRNVFGDKINHRIGSIHYMPCMIWKYHLWDVLVEFPFSAERLVLVPCINARRCKGGCLSIIIVHQNVYHTSRVLPVGDIIFPVTEL